MRKTSFLSILSTLALAPFLPAHTVLVEAESMELGGWKLDTQFIEIMGSPYLLAHGLGQPVADATAEVSFPAAGEYRVWVRTKDWAPGSPGKFQVAVGGEVLETVFGAGGEDWHWQDGGTVNVGAGTTGLALKDLTGFNGRCDAIVFSDEEGYVPPDVAGVLPEWRRELLGVPAEPELAGDFDLVVVGGGYAGMGAAVSGARMGLKVALVQNRGVLGGNGSSEVRVWAMGNTPGGLYPVGDIINELSDRAKKSPGTYEEFGDAKKEEIVRAEDNIALFFYHHAFKVEMEAGADPAKIESVTALDVKTGALRQFKAPLFVDCTGHGTIGMMAGADLTMIPDGRMGMSNMWAWENADAPQSFPTTPWALDLDEEDFPYPKDFHAQWFWESGYDKHPLHDLEEIRDHNLRAGFGAWNAIKNGGAYADVDDGGKGHANARLTWMAYIGGTRETQQLLGDVVLTEEDVVSKRAFPDGCVLTTWSIDLHYPKKQYLDAAPDNPFISIAVHGKGVNRSTGYPVPYRCFYSRNIDNLFMAGRNVSVTHKALGTVRVMRTGGMMGVVVGKAAALAKEHGTNPRGVYQSHLDELIELLKLPGKARRASLDAPFEVPVGTIGLSTDLPGLVIDDDNAIFRGNWGSGNGIKGYLGNGYHYASERGTATFIATLPNSGRYEVRLAYQPHENRSHSVPVTVYTGEEEKKSRVDQTVAGDLAGGMVSLGEFEVERGRPMTVTVSVPKDGKHATVDAVQILPVK